VRVYFAGTAALLTQLAHDGVIAGPVEGFAATDSVVRSLGETSAEDVEFALTIAAAESSAAAVGIGRGARGRRFVLVADVGDADVVVDDVNPGAVTLDGSLSLAEVEAILADPDDIVLHTGVSDELAWFATQEIKDLLA
jgi:hypothetical protein